jgi:hypothetical protein
LQPSWEISPIVGIGNGIWILTVALLLVLFLFFLLTPLLELCISKASSDSDLKANIVCRFVSANPNRVSTLLAGLILENLDSFD